MERKNNRLIYTIDAFNKRMEVKILSDMSNYSSSFEIKVNPPNDETYQALVESDEISKNPNKGGYDIDEALVKLKQ